MGKLAQRLVALALVPCLVLDPAAAAIASATASSSCPAMIPSARVQFDREAIPGSLAWMIQAFNEIGWQTRRSHRSLQPAYAKAGYDSSSIHFAKKIRKSSGPSQPRVKAPVKYDIPAYDPDEMAVHERLGFSHDITAQWVEGQIRRRRGEKASFARQPRLYRDLSTKALSLVFFEYVEKERETGMPNLRAPLQAGSQWIYEMAVVSISPETGQPNLDLVTIPTNILKEPTDTEKANWLGKKGLQRPPSHTITLNHPVSETWGAGRPREIVESHPGTTIWINYHGTGAEAKRDKQVIEQTLQKAGFIMDPRSSKYEFVKVKMTPDPKAGLGPGKRQDDGGFAVSMFMGGIFDRVLRIVVQSLGVDKASRRERALMWLRSREPLTRLSDLADAERWLKDLIKPSWTLLSYAMISNDDLKLLPVEMRVERPTVQIIRFPGSPQLSAHISIYFLFPATVKDLADALLANELVTPSELTGSQISLAHVGRRPGGDLVKTIAWLAASVSLQGLAGVPALESTHMSVGMILDPQALFSLPGLAQTALQSISVFFAFKVFSGWIPVFASAAHDTSRNGPEILRQLEIWNKILVQVLRSADNHYFFTETIAAESVKQVIHKKKQQIPAIENLFYLLTGEFTIRPIPFADVREPLRISTILTLLFAAQHTKRGSFDSEELLNLISDRPPSTQPRGRAGLRLLDPKYQQELALIRRAKEIWGFPPDTPPTGRGPLIHFMAWLALVLQAANLHARAPANSTSYLSAISHSIPGIAPLRPQTLLPVETDILRRPPVTFRSTQQVRITLSDTDRFIEYVLSRGLLVFKVRPTGHDKLSGKFQVQFMKASETDPNAEHMIHHAETPVLTLDGELTFKCPLDPAELEKVGGDAMLRIGFESSEPSSAEFELTDARLALPTPSLEPQPGGSDRHAGFQRTPNPSSSAAMRRRDGPRIDLPGRSRQRQMRQMDEGISPAEAWGPRKHRRHSDGSSPFNPLLSESNSILLTTKNTLQERLAKFDETLQPIVTQMTSKFSQLGNHSPTDYETWLKLHFSYGEAHQAAALYMLYLDAEAELMKTFPLFLPAYATKYGHRTDRGQFRLGRRSIQTFLASGSTARFIVLRTLLMFENDSHSEFSSFWKNGLKNQEEDLAYFSLSAFPEVMSLLEAEFSGPSQKDLIDGLRKQLGIRVPSQDVATQLAGLPSDTIVQWKDASGQSHVQFSQDLPFEYFDESGYAWTWIREGWRESLDAVPGPGNPPLHSQVIPPVELWRAIKIVDEYFDLLANLWSEYQTSVRLFRYEPVAKKAWREWEKSLAHLKTLEADLAGKLEDFTFAKALLERNPAKWDPIRRLISPVAAAATRYDAVANTSGGKGSFAWYPILDMTNDLWRGIDGDRAFQSIIRMRQAVDALAGGFRGLYVGNGGSGSQGPMVRTIAWLAVAAVLKFAVPLHALESAVPLEPVWRPVVIVPGLSQTVRQPMGSQSQTPLPEEIDLLRGMPRLLQSPDGAKFLLTPSVRFAEYVRARGLWTAKIRTLEGQATGRIHTEVMKEIGRDPDNPNTLKMIIIAARETPVLTLQTTEMSFAIPLDPGVLAEAMDGTLIGLRIWFEPIPETSSEAPLQLTESKLLRDATPTPRPRSDEKLALTVSLQPLDKPAGMIAGLVWRRFFETFAWIAAAAGLTWLARFQAPEYPVLAAGSMLNLTDLFSWSGLIQTASVLLAWKALSAWLPAIGAMAPAPPPQPPSVRTFAEIDKEVRRWPVSKVFEEALNDLPGGVDPNMSLDEYLERGRTGQIEGWANDHRYFAYRVKMEAVKQAAAGVIVRSISHHIAHRLAKRDKPPVDKESEHIQRILGDAHVYRRILSKPDEPDFVDNIIPPPADAHATRYYIERVQRTEGDVVIHELHIKPETGFESWQTLPGSSKELSDAEQFIALLRECVDPFGDQRLVIFRTRHHLFINQTFVEQHALQLLRGIRDVLSIYEHDHGAIKPIMQLSHHVFTGLPKVPLQKSDVFILFAVGKVLDLWTIEPASDRALEKRLKKHVYPSYIPFITLVRPLNDFQRRIQRLAQLDKRNELDRRREALAAQIESLRNQFLDLTATSRTLHDDLMEIIQRLVQISPEMTQEPAAQIDWDYYKNLQSEINNNQRIVQETREQLTLWVTQLENELKKWTEEDDGWDRDNKPGPGPGSFLKSVALILSAGILSGAWSSENVADGTGWEILAVGLALSVALWEGIPTLWARVQTIVSSRRQRKEPPTNTPKKTPDEEDPDIDRPDDRTRVPPWVPKIRPPLPHMPPSVPQRPWADPPGYRYLQSAA